MRFETRVQLLSILILVVSPVWHTVADDPDWPQWRGPGRDAISSEQGLLKSWMDGPPALSWQVSGLGEGYSSVVVGAGMVFTTGKQHGDVFVSALDQVTGARRWRTKIANTSRIPCSTPTLDGELLFALGPDGDLVCLQSRTGRVIWQRSFVNDFDGLMQSGRGYGESPLVDGGKLICTPGGKAATLVALDKVTGKTIWKSAVPEIGPKGRDGAGFSSIVISEAAGLRQYVQLVGRGLVGVSAANGRYLWGYNDIANRTANIPTPIARGNLVFAANGYGAGSVLLRLVPQENNGIVAETVYQLNGGRFQNHHGGVILIGDHIYGGHGSNNGLPTCVDLLSGAVVWKRRGPGVGSAAVIYADDRLYMRYQNGVMALIEASPQGYKLQGTFDIPSAGADSWSHPVVAAGTLYLREKDQIYAYNLRSQAGKLPREPGQPGKIPETPEIARLRDTGAIVTSLTTPKREPYQRMRLFEHHRRQGKAAGCAVTLSDTQLASDGTISADVLAQLRECDGLKELHLTGTGISQRGLAQLSNLSDLEVLNLELCTNLPERFAIPDPLLSKLKVLIVSGTLIGDTGLAQVKSCKELLGLDLEVCENISDDGLKNLSSLKSLRWLVLKRTGFGPNPISDAGLNQIANLNHLELLDLYGNRITDQGMSTIATMRRLRQLDLSLTGVTSEGLKHLASLRDLERLDLTYSEGFAGPIIDDSGVGYLAQLVKLKSLSLIGAKIQDESLIQLSSLLDLERLNLVNTKTTSAGVQRLQKVIADCAIVR